MPFINYNELPHLKIWDGIHGAITHTDELTFAQVTLEAGASLPEHHHIQEQWTHVIEGNLEFNMNGETKVLGPGMTAHLPPNLPHSAKALSQCRVIDCFRPVREDFKLLEPWT
jgi:quercetin dioxygenase-like cupin family protein